jgi:tetratricopeptide repeat protein
MSEFDEIRSFLGGQGFIPVLHDIHSERASGYLTVTAGAETTIFRISGGRLSHIADAGPQPFESAVVNAGLSEKKVLKARKRSRRENLRLSRVVEEDLGLSRDAQCAAMGHYISGIFLDLMTVEDMIHEWKEGPFDRSRHDEDGDGPAAAVPLTDVIVLIPENWNDPATLERIHTPDAEVLRLSATAQEIPEGELDEISEEVLTLADGERDIAEMIEASAQSRHELLGAIHLLLSQGLLEPLDPAALEKLAGHFRKAGRLDKCLRLYLRAEQVGETSFELAETIGGIYEMIDEGEKAVETYASCARRAAKDGQHEEARSCYEKILRLFPTHGEAILELKDIYLAEGRKKRAVEMLRRLANLKASRADAPGHLEALLAIVEMGQAEPEVLEDIAPLIIELKGADQALEFFKNTARTCAEDNQRPSALICLEHARRIAPKSPDVALGRGLLLAEDGDTEGSLSELLRVVDLIDSGEGGDTAEGLLERACEAILETDPDRAEIRARLAEAYRGAGRENRALDHMHVLMDGKVSAEVLEYIVRMQPGDLDAKRRLAQAYADADSIEQAARTYVDLTRALRETDELDEALATIEKLLSIAPVHLEGIRTRADVLTDLDRADEAREARTGLFHILRGAGLESEAVELAAPIIADDLSDSGFVSAYAALLEKTESQAGSTLTRLARRALKAEHPGLALELAERALRCSPRSSSVRKLRDEMLETDDLSTAASLDRLYAERAEKRTHARGEELSAEAEERISREVEKLARESDKKLEAEKDRLAEDLEARADKAREEIHAEADALVEERTREIDRRVAEDVAKQGEKLREEMQEALEEAKEDLAEESKAALDRRKDELEGESEEAIQKLDLEREERSEKAVKKRVEELEDEADQRVEERARVAEQDVLATLDDRRKQLELEMEKTLAERMRELGEAAEQELADREAELAAQLRESAAAESAEAARQSAIELEEHKAALETEHAERYAERQTALQEELAAQLEQERERLQQESAEALEAKTKELEETSLADLDEHRETLASEHEEALAEARAKLEEELTSDHKEKLVALEQEFSEKVDARREELEQEAATALAAHREELETEFERRVEEKEQEAKERYEKALEEESEKLRATAAEELAQAQATQQTEADNALTERQQALSKEFQEALDGAKRDLAVALEDRARKQEEDRQQTAESELSAAKQGLETQLAAQREEESHRLQEESETALAGHRQQLEQDSTRTIEEEKARLTTEIGEEAGARLASARAGLQAEHSGRMNALDNEVVQRVAAEVDSQKIKLRTEYQKEEQRLQAFYSIRHAGQSEEIRKTVELGVEKTLLEREDAYRDQLRGEMEEKYEARLAEAESKPAPAPAAEPVLPRNVTPSAAPAPQPAAPPPAAPTLAPPTPPTPAPAAPASPAPAAQAPKPGPGLAPEGVNTGRNQTISMDFISSAAAAARQVRMGGPGSGGGAPLGGAPLDPEQAYPEAPSGAAPPTPVPTPSEPKSIPNSALSGIVGKLKALKGAGLGAPAPAPQPVEPDSPEETAPVAETTPDADSSSAEEPAAAVEPAPPAEEQEPAGTDETPAEEPQKAAPVDFRSLAKQSVTQLVSGMESEAGEEQA